MDAFNKVNATDETSKVLAEIEGLSSSDAVQILASKLQLWKTKQTALEAGDTSVAWSQVPLIIDALIDQIGERDKVKHPKLELLIGTAVMMRQFMVKCGAEMEARARREQRAMRKAKRGAAPATAEDRTLEEMRAALSSFQSKLAPAACSDDVRTAAAPKPKKPRLPSMNGAPPPPPTAAAPPPPPRASV